MLLLPSYGEGSTRLPVQAENLVVEVVWRKAPHVWVFLIVLRGILQEGVL